jgi:uncharacterized protein (UPF0128 family)
MKDDNIYTIVSETEKTKANLEKLRREMPEIIESQKLIAKIRYETFKAYMDAGFTEEQAMNILKSTFT